jgi:putative membrane protein
MVADHTNAANELQQLATKKGVALPSAMDSSHQSDLDKLSKLNGAKLDKEYTDDMVDDHEEDVKEFRKAAQEVKDPDLRAWAAKMIPTLENHLSMARDLKAQVKH